MRRFQLCFVVLRASKYVQHIEILASIISVKMWLPQVASLSWKHCISLPLVTLRHIGPRRSGLYISNIPCGRDKTITYICTTMCGCIKGTDTPLNFTHSRLCRYKAAKPHPWSSYKAAKPHPIALTRIEKMTNSFFVGKWIWCRISVCSATSTVTSQKESRSQRRDPNCWLSNTA